MDINSIRNYYTRNNVNSVYTKDVNTKSADSVLKTSQSNVDVVDSDKSEIGVITIDGKIMPILKNEEDMYEVKYILDSSLVAPVLLNQKVGTVQLLYKGEIIYCNDLISIESADNNNLKYLIDNIIDEWF